ncbi:unnamed protein product, partial [Ectocarpus fasciculatus]
MTRVNFLGGGDVLLCPVVFSTDNGEDSGLLVLLRRESVGTETDYSLSIVNTHGGAGGLDYHPMAADGTDGSLLRAMSFTLRGISNHKIKNSMFWFLVFKCAIQPNPKYGVSFFYEKLIPFLTTSPLLASVEKEALDFYQPPLSGDHSNIHASCFALMHFGRICGLSQPQSRHLLCAAKWSLLRFVLHDLSIVADIAPGEVGLLRIAAKNFSMNASAQAEPYSGTTPNQLTAMLSCVEDVDARLTVLDQARRDSLPLFELQRDVSLPQICHWPWFGRLCRDIDVDTLAGEAPVPAILRPVEMTLVPDRVSSFNEVCNALRHAVNLCTLLSNQRAQIRNSYTLRACLVEHLFIRVIPLPLPITHPDWQTKCFWRAQPMRYETQADLLRMLNLLCRHFTTATLSMKLTRAGDAVRILVLACMAAICDACLRKIACDIPSQSSLHYSGEAQGPVHPFGFEMGQFAFESEYLQFNTPEMSSARTQVLDYFSQLKLIVMDDHVMFKFEKGLVCGQAETAFIRQICIQMGWQYGREEAYITGEIPDILELYPEIGFFRDLLFMFKLTMVPTSDALPELKAWTPADARLHWSSKQGSFTVQGFGKKLDCTVPELPPEEGASHAAAAASGSARKKGLFSRFLRMVGLRSLPRASPSKANPSVLAGERVDDEDDVLHLKILPNFDESMGSRDVEHLLQYLTAPYLRIPLLLKFFSNESRLKSLRVQELQDVLDSALFEPGRWQEEYNKDTPQTVPSHDREHLSTPAGLLFNEFLMSPKIILNAVQAMLETVLEMDTGKYSELSECILYVIRLAVRIEGYLLFLMKNDAFKKGAKEDDRFMGAYQEAQVRGVDFKDEILAEAVECQASLRVVMDTKAFRMLARWIKCAKLDGKMNTACMLHAHMAFLYRNVEVDGLNPKTIFAIVSSQTFLCNNFEYDLDMDGRNKNSVNRGNSEDLIKSTLGIPQIELFGMFQRNRVKILNWLLAATPEMRSAVMDAIVQLVEEGRSGGKEMVDRSENTHISRNWVGIDQQNFVGKFVPDNEIPNFNKCMSAKARIDFETWLRELTTAIIDTEINIQFGEFSIKKHTIVPLDQKIMRNKDFTKVFNDVVKAGDVVQCAEVTHTTNRHWVRLIGMGYDIQVWTPDDRIPAHNCSAFCSYDLCAAGWLKKILDPLRDRILPGVQLFFRGDPVTIVSADCAILYGYAKPPKPPKPSPATPKDGDAKGRRGSTLPPPRTSSAGDGDAAGGEEAVEEDKECTLKEIIVYRYPRVVHVFDVTSFGRRFYRTQIYTSSQTFSLHDVTIPPLPPPPVVNEKISAAVISRIIRKGPSLVIMRDLTQENTGFQTYVPNRYLRGIVPDALLHHYMFWQNADETITGYIQSRSASASMKSVVNITLKQDPSTKDKSGNGNSTCFATVKRTYLLEDNSRAESNDTSPEINITPDPNKPELYLVNMLNVLNFYGSSHKGDPNARFSTDCVGELMHFDGEDTSAHALARLLLRLDSLSHILAWSKTNPADGSAPVSIDLIELPRLRLTLEKQVLPDGTVRYNCLEQSGLWLAKYTKELNVDHLFEGLPHSVLLTNSDQEYFVLLPATAKPVMVKEASDGFSYRLSLDRKNKEWVENCGESAHFVYLIHISGGFLVSRSVGSSLYLLLFLTIMRRYDEAFRLVETCVCDSTLSRLEDQFFKAFGSIQESLFPEAHALRLKFYFVSHGCCDVMPYPFDLRRELKGYIAKRRAISAHCRLEPEEEAYILFSANDPNDMNLVNRERLVKATFDLNLNKSSVRSPGNAFTFVYPTQVTQKILFDDAIDLDLLDTTKAQFKTWIGKLSVVKYQKPEDVTGIEAIRFLMEVTELGLDLRGKLGGLGFFFLYELLNGSLNITVIPDDTPHSIGSALLRILENDAVSAAQGVTGQTQQFSILRIMAEHPDICSQMPVFEDKRKLKLPSLAGLDIFQTHVKNAATFLRSKSGSLHLAKLGFNTAPGYSPSVVVEGAPSPEDDAVNFSTGRIWITPRITDFNCPRRVFSGALPPFLNRIGGMITNEDVAAFAGSPLNVIGLEKYVEFKSLSSRNLPAVEAKSPLEVMMHPSSRSHIARNSVSRLEQDIADFALDENSTNAPVLCVVGGGEDIDGSNVDGAISHMQTLLKTLEHLKLRDQGFVRQGIEEVVACCNARSSISNGRAKEIPFLRHKLSIRAGMEASLAFSFISASTATSDASGNLRRYCPFMSTEEEEGLTSCALLLMMAVNRIAQVNLAMMQTRSVMKLLSSLKAALARHELLTSSTVLIIYKELASSSANLAATLSARRDFSSSLGGGKYEVDPRFLLFEFCHNLLLRPPQVKLVRKLLVEIQNGKSVCHQMIMGAGKTTVVGPLLAMLLASSTTLMTEVVPNALLDFSTGVLRERFSTVVRKPVFTFTFERYNKITPELLFKLRTARYLRAVVVSTPSAVKSFMLKFLELCHILDGQK